MIGNEKIKYRLTSGIKAQAFDLMTFSLKQTDRATFDLIAIDATAID